MNTELTYAFEGLGTITFPSPAAKEAFVQSALKHVVDGSPYMVDFVNKHLKTDVDFQHLDQHAIQERANVSRHDYDHGSSKKTVHTIGT